MSCTASKLVPFGGFDINMLDSHSNDQFALGIFPGKTNDKSAVIDNDDNSPSCPTPRLYNLL